MKKGRPDLAPAAGVQGDLFGNLVVREDAAKPSRKPDVSTPVVRARVDVPPATPGEDPSGAARPSEAAGVPVDATSSPSASEKVVAPDDNDSARVASSPTISSPATQRALDAQLASSPPTSSPPIQRGAESREQARAATARALPNPTVHPHAPAKVTVTTPGSARAKPQRVVLSVGELTRNIKGALERGFPHVCVRGEVSGFRGANVRGHLYFSLKDQDACIDAKLWQSLARTLKFKVRDGLEVIVEGSIDVYEPQGRYSLIINRIEPAGQGALALAFQQLKERLMAEGLFGDKRIRPQRPIPFLPRRIGVVTSITGAALRDFLRVLHQRHPRMSVLIADARVQGEGSAPEVARAIRRLSRTDVDVIVVTRGGGSIEDLWTFNEEVVARAIFASPKPVVSAIGHEVDYTISDFVADYRAPTPSAAAEKLAPVLRDLELGLGTTASRLRKAMERQVLADRQKLERLGARLTDPRRLLGQKRLHVSTQADRLARAMRVLVRSQRERQKVLADRLARQRPEAKLRQRREQLTKLSQRLEAAMRDALKRREQTLARSRTALQRATPSTRIQQAHRRLDDQSSRVRELIVRRLARERQVLHGLTGKLEAMSPLKVMARGYSVTFRAADRYVLRSAAEVTPGDQIVVSLAAASCSTLSECDEVTAQVLAVRPAGRSGGTGSEN